MSSTQSPNNESQKIIDTIKHLLTLDYTACSEKEKTAMREQFIFVFEKWYAPEMIKNDYEWTIFQALVKYIEGNKNYANNLRNIINALDSDSSATQITGLAVASYKRVLKQAGFHMVQVQEDSEVKRYDETGKKIVEDTTAMLSEYIKQLNVTVNSGKDHWSTQGKGFFGTKTPEHIGNIQAEFKKSNIMRDIDQAEEKNLKEFINKVLIELFKSESPQSPSKRSEDVKEFYKDQLQKGLRAVGITEEDKENFKKELLKNSPGFGKK